MVRRFVKYQQVWFCQQHVGQSNAFLLTSTKFPHTLTEVANLQLRQHLLGFQHFLVLALMIETSIEHTLVRIKYRRLLQHAHFQVTTKHNTSLVVAFLTAEYGQQRRLTCTILCNQSYLLAFANRETDVAEQRQGTERLREVLYV